MLFWLILLGFFVMSSIGNAADSIQVLYKCNESNATANSIRPWLQITNNGTTTLNLSTVKLRYWYTVDTSRSQAYVCDYARIGAANITGTFVQMATGVINADYYLEVGFTSGAGSLAPGASTGEIQLRFNKTDWSNYNQSDDYSFIAAQTSYAANNKITGYINGVLVFGTEPGGNVTTPTATYASTPTPTAIITATPTSVVTATPTPIRTATPRRTVTPRVTITATPVRTATPTPTSVVAVTPTPIVTATPTPAGTATPVVTASPTTPPATGFVTRVGTRLMLDNKTFYFNGTNQYYLFYKSHAMVDEVLEDAAALGLKVMRTWGFCDGKYQGAYCFQPSPGVYDEPTFRNMDYTIYKAQQCGIKLIIPLVNNWDDMGGMNQYVQWAGGGSHDDFYTNPTCWTTYKNYVKYFLNRVNTITGMAYKDDPTIMMWELGNEPRCTSDTTGAKLQAWIDEMAAYIKSLDSKHLLGTGMEGFYNGSEGSNYIKNNQNPNIDVCSAHLYPGFWSLSEAQALAWISDHANDAHNVIGKPFYLGEFGWAADQSSLTKRNQVYTDWYNKLNETNSDGAMFWLLSGHQDDGTLYPDYDTFTVYYPENSATNTVISNYSTTVAAKSGIAFDNTAPTVAIAAPANNASVSGTVHISGTAMDNNALSKTEICFDGGVYRATSGTAASWSYDWDTTKVINGTHTITVKATDTQGNTATSTVTVTVGGSSPAANWSITGYKSKDDGYWFIYYLHALNTSGMAQTGHYVFRFFIVPDGTTIITSHYDSSSVYNSSVTPSTSFKVYYGTTQYYEIDMGTRTINDQQYLGYVGDIGQNDGKFMSANDWSSSVFPTAWGTVTHVALYKDGILVAGYEP